MYAELLELNPGAVLNPRIDVEDGLPDDLDTGAWTAISGVPVGKRCLAVTYASSGIAGTGTNFPNRATVRLIHGETDKRILANVQCRTQYYGPGL